MRKAIATLLVVVGFVGGVALGLYTFINGILDIINAAKATPIVEHTLVFGILSVLLAGLVGWLVFGVASLLALAVAGSGARANSSLLRRR